MKVFVSWSKSRSQQIALVLRDWLPEVIQQINPWVSSEDIDKGQRWSTEVGLRLNECSQGILCVTRENVSQPWLNFEAGALAKSLDESRVRPVLLDMRTSDIKGPLAQFQASMANDRSDMFKLVKSLNDACDHPLEAGRLQRTFDRNWHDFQEKVEAIAQLPSTEQPPSQRSSEDMISEILDRVRHIQRSTGLGIGYSDGAVDGVILEDGSKLAVGQEIEDPEHGSGLIRRMKFIRRRDGEGYVDMRVVFPETGRVMTKRCEDVAHVIRANGMSLSWPKHEPGELL